MAAPLDPRIVVAYPLDEPGSTDLRKSVAPLVHNLTPLNESGSQGVPAVNDGVAGRAVNLLPVQTGLTSGGRYLRGALAAWNVHPLHLPLPRSDGATGFAYGFRFNYQNGGASQTQQAMWMGEAGVAFGHLGLALATTAAVGGVIRGRLVMTLPDTTQESITAVAWTDTDGLVAALTADYIQRFEWWRATVRVFHLSLTTYIIQVILYRESTGARYRLTRVGLAPDYAFPTRTVALMIGGNTSTNTFQGYIDDAWMMLGDLSEEAAVDLSRGGLKLPRLEDRAYRNVPKVLVRALFHDDTGTRRQTTPMLTTGGTLERVGVSPTERGEAFALRTEAFAPGRPMILKWCAPLYKQKGGARAAKR